MKRILSWQTFPHSGSIVCKISGVISDPDIRFHPCPKTRNRGSAIAVKKIVNWVATILGPEGKLNAAETTMPMNALNAPNPADSTT